MKDMIIQDPKILSGKPIIEGTRISVEVILELISSGMAVKDILKEYPALNKKQVQAALDFASKVVHKQESYIFDKTSVITHEVHRRR